MSYTPPNGNAVNFSWQGAAAYVAPNGNAVNFAFPANAYTVTGAGSIPISGAGTVAHGFAVAGSGSLAITGIGSVQYTSTTVIATGDGVVPVVGAGTAAHGEAVAGAGSISLNGAGTAAHGEAVAGAGSISLSGAGAFIHFRYEVSGQVQQGGVLINRHVRVYRRDTGALVGEGDTVFGQFKITTGFEQIEHYIVPVNLAADATDWTPPVANRVVSVLAQDA